MGKILLLGLLLSVNTFAFTLGTSQSSDVLRGWKTSTLTFKINVSECSITQEALLKSIDNAMNVWNSVTTSGIKLSRGEIVTDSLSDISNRTSAGDPYIACDSDFGSTFNLSSTDIDFVGGIGQFYASGANIDYGFLFLNSVANAGGNIANLTATQLDILIAHEIGHVLGLGHTNDESSLMYYNISSKKALTLSEDDEAGITYLNPRAELGKDKVYGCAQITNNTTPPNFMNFINSFYYLFIIFFIYIYLKRKSVRFN